MPLLPGWEDRLAEVPAPAPDDEPAFRLPRSPEYYAGRTTRVSDAEGARAMAELAGQRPVAWAGLDAEFRYDRVGVFIDARHTAYDPRSVRPLLLSLALAESGPDGGKLHVFVVDLRVPGVLPHLKELLRLPVCFVSHFAQAELFCLWQLGLDEPRTLWDTWVHEKAARLGRGHKNYRLKEGAGPAEAARAAEEAERAEELGCSLLATCGRYGVTHPFGGDEERLRASFLGHPDGAPFSDEQVEYAAADAVAAARLYPRQVQAATGAGILHHLVRVEMPWAVTNARMAWRGVRVDREKCRRAAVACDAHLARLRPELARHGITDVRSPAQLQSLFGRLGLLDCFRRGGKLSFDKERLRALEGRHEAVPLIRAARRALDLQEERILTDELVGADGRVHPDHRQLGTHSGRQTSRWPNVLGLGRVFRPLVVPGPGRGIGEADWSQIEVGVAAAVYGDGRLAEMFNTGDVYSAMAQGFYRDELTAEERALPGAEFKRRRRDLRERMKVCTLGIIYGLTAHGLSLHLGAGLAQAVTLLCRFMEQFPALRRAQADAAASAALRGYAATVTGLRRHRAGAGGQPSAWERNWMVNHPVQGSAAVVFKAAGNRLDRLYRRYDAWLVVPMHDAFVFEAPLAQLECVARLTERVMCEAVRDYFPCLLPKVEVNIARPECWNKDGRTDSVERWINDPTFTF